MNLFESIWIAGQGGQASEVRDVPDHHPTRDRLGRYKPVNSNLGWESSLPGTFINNFIYKSFYFANILHYFMSIC